MATRNNTTGDKIKSRPSTKAYREKFEKIFGRPLPEKKKREPHK